MIKRLLGCLLLLACAACATPQSQPHGTAAASPKLVGGALVTSDGTRLPYRAWLPADEPRAVVVALHGFNDYSHGFEIPAEYMRLRGVALFAYDQRGFGSAPSRGFWAGEDNLETDAADMVNAVRQIYPRTPVYLMGESMGGAVAITAATRPGFPHVNGLILSAPAIWGGDTMNAFFRISLWTLAHTFPGKMLTGQDLHILASDNIDMLRAFSSDPLVIKATRVDSVWGLLQLMDKSYANFSKVPVRMLVLYGANDQVIPSEPIRNALRNAPPGAKGAYYPLGFHMLLRDLHGDVPVRDILSWIDDPNMPLPSGADLWVQKLLK
jgi:alpha-beta hydrolase superfamily lysophospholipase